MHPYVYLMFGDGDELTGLEHSPRTDEPTARREAMRLLAIDRDTREVEIWREGCRIGSVVAAAGGVSPGR